MVYSKIKPGNRSRAASTREVHETARSAKSAATAVSVFSAAAALPGNKIMPAGGILISNITVIFFLEYKIIFASHRIAYTAISPENRQRKRKAVKRPTKRTKTSEYSR